VIASGAADAGMGIRSVAEQFRLDFIPMGEETYFLAARTAPARLLVDRLADQVRPVVRRTAGYGPART
jgi:molybdate-binding protein